MSQLSTSLNQIRGSLLAALLLSGVVWECDENKPSDSFTYPLETGNIWVYDRTITLIYYEDSSGVQTNLDTIDYGSYTVTTTVAGLKNFGDTLSTKEIVTSYQMNGEDMVGSVYYVKTSSALLMMAYKGSGPYGYPKQVEPHHFIFHGHEFSDVATFSNALQIGFLPQSTQSDSIYFDTPPVQALAFPFKIGNEWDYRTVGHPWHMGRHVVARTNLELDSLSYDCYQVNTRYDLHDDGTWDDDIAITDYYAREGLVQREIKVLGGLETDSNGGITGRKIDYYDRYVLIESMIQD